MITEDNQRSIPGRAAMFLLRASAKTVLSASRRTTAEAEIEKGLKLSGSNSNVFALPKDKKAVYRAMTVAGFPCICMQKKGRKEKSNRAILYLHGGLRNLWKSEIGIARGYMNRTGADLRYPLYPSPTEGPITESIRVCYECYRQLAAEYGAENTVIVGSSFGGYYALQILNKINLTRERVGMPALVIALSPNGIPDREDELNHMKKLAENDPMLSFSAVMQTKDIAKWYDKNVPDYTIWPALMDFRNAPPVYIWYGEETVSGNAPCYQRAFDHSGSGEQLHIYIQKGMMHDYACMPVFPESKRAYEEQIRLIGQINPNRQ